MKQMKIFVLFVFCLVEFHATAEARYMFDLPHAGVQPSDVKNVWSDLKEFLDAFDSKSSGHPDPNDVVTRCIQVNDSDSGVIGKFCLTLNYSPSSGGLVSVLTVNGKILYGGYVIADLLDKFVEGLCLASPLTPEKSSCFLIEGNRSRTDQKINCCAALLRDGKIVIGDFGCFSLRYQGANADGMMKAPPTDTKEFLDLLQRKRKEFV